MRLFKSKVFKALLSIFLVLVILFFAIDCFVVLMGKSTFLDENEVPPKTVDCIVVLGCSVKPDGTPSDMLFDRVKKACELYKKGVAKKILMSGDNGTKQYNEVLAMKKLAITLGVKKDDIFCDHAGFSTYETVFRAKEIFSIDSMVIVTQRYHLKRAAFIGKALKIETFGAESDYRTYGAVVFRNVREMLARIKDFFFVYLKKQPTFMGEKISLMGPGND